MLSLLLKIFKGKSEIVELSQEEGKVSLMAGKWKVSELVEEDGKKGWFVEEEGEVIGGR